MKKLKQIQRMPMLKRLTFLEQQAETQRNSAWFKQSVDHLKTLINKNKTFDYQFKSRIQNLINGSN